MKIYSVCLENIKKFGPKGAVFNFSKHHNIYTVSGKNGAGKTAVFKAIQIFQKLFFFQQIESEDFDKRALEIRLIDEVDSLLSSQYGLIDIAFVDGDQTFHIKLKLESGQEKLKYDFIDGIDGSIADLQKYWNVSNPRNIVAFLDAGKSFSDFGVGLDKISLLSRRQKNKDLILDCIFDPEHTLQAIYKKTVLDHVQYRLDPSRRYDYFRSANRAVKHIAPNIEVKNISATKVDGHLVMLGKTSETAQLFDVKDFSAGERALYLTLLFIFYLPNVGILIVDEPENHLHESLLMGFYNFIRDVVGYGSATSWLRSLGSSDSSDDFLDESKGVLAQVFLTTHSKALIYHNLGQGECLVLTENGMSSLEDGAIENELRNAGISTVFSRTLFVEGTTDSSLLSGVLEKSGIKVLVADSCKEVIEYFKKISKIRGKMHGAVFCFAIDSDNRTKEDIDEIRKIDPEFFEQSFIVLARHEMENYLIDEKLISDALNPALEALSRKKINSSLLDSIFSSESSGLKNQSKSKYLSSGLRIALKNSIVDPVCDVKSISNGSVSTVISKVFSDSLVDDVNHIFESLGKKFDEEWESGWVSLVDGKAFLGRVLAKLSKECAGINNETIRDNIILQLQRRPEDYKAGDLIREINQKLDAQHANY